MRESELAYGRYLVLELAAVLDRLSIAAGGQPLGRDDDPGERVLERALAELGRELPARNDRCETVLRIYSGDEAVEQQG